MQNPAFLLEPWVLAWFMANLVTGICLLHIPIEMRSWTREVPPKGTGFRALSTMFQVLIAGAGLHHLAMLAMIWGHPIVKPIVVADVALSVLAVVVSVTLYTARSMLRSAFHAMLTHSDEWNAS